MKIHGPPSGTRLQSTLDFVIAHRDSKLRVDIMETTLSDHQALLVSFEVPKRIRVERMCGKNRFRIHPHPNLASMNLKKS